MKNNNKTTGCKSKAWFSGYTVEHAEEILDLMKQKSTEKTALEISDGPGGFNCADRDMVSAADLKKRLEDSLDKINESVCNIYEEMSGFNSPGMKKAYYDAIAKGMSGHTNMFMLESAKRELNKYYDREEV